MSLVDLFFVRYFILQCLRKDPESRRRQLHIRTYVSHDNKVTVKLIEMIIFEESLVLQMVVWEKAKKWSTNLYYVFPA